jgi:hypothetical protein
MHKALLAVSLFTCPAIGTCPLLAKHQVHGSGAIRSLQLKVCEDLALQVAPISHRLELCWLLLRELFQRCHHSLKCWLKKEGYGDPGLGGVCIDDAVRGGLVQAICPHLQHTHSKHPFQKPIWSACMQRSICSWDHWLTSCTDRVLQAWDSRTVRCARN